MTLALLYLFSFFLLVFCLAGLEGRGVNFCISVLMCSHVTHVLKICVCRTIHWLLNKMKHSDRINARALSMPKTKREQDEISLQSLALYSMACRVVNWDTLWMQLTH